jgi:hypothetical protein
VIDGRNLTQGPQPVSIDGHTFRYKEEIVHDNGANMKAIANLWIFVAATAVAVSSPTRASCETYPTILPTPPFALASRIELLEQQNAAAAAQYLGNEDFKLASGMTTDASQPKEKDVRYVLKAPYFGGMPNRFQAKLKDDTLVFTAGVLGRGGRGEIGYFLVDVPEPFHKLVCHRSGAM